MESIVLISTGDIMHNHRFLVCIEYSVFLLQFQNLFHGTTLVKSCQETLDQLAMLVMVNTVVLLYMQLVIVFT